MSDCETVAPGVDYIKDGQTAEMMHALATKLGKQIVSMQLSQSAEYQADALGLQFMRDAGYDPKKGLLILERMDQLAQSRGAGNPVLGRIFSTHPPMPERLQRLRKAIALHEPGHPPQMGHYNPPVHRQCLIRGDRLERRRDTHVR